MRDLARSRGQERTCICLKYIEAQVAIVVGGMDVDIVLILVLKSYVEEQCIAML
jgi:hypothetical protein